MFERERCICMYANWRREKSLFLGSCFVRVRDISGIDAFDKSDSGPAHIDEKLWDRFDCI